MSNLKDTDIDDLFRRASEKYPLRTDSSDWDRMAAALEKDPPPPGDVDDNDDRRKKRRFFWLFLLLPLGVGGLGYYAWHSGARMHAAATAGASVGASVATNTPAAANTTAEGKTASAAETRGANPTAVPATATPAKPATLAGEATSVAPVTGTTTPVTGTTTPVTGTTTPVTGTTTPVTGTTTPVTGSTNRDDRRAPAKAGSGTNGGSGREAGNGTNTGRGISGGNGGVAGDGYRGGNDRPASANRRGNSREPDDADGLRNAGGAFGDASVSLKQNRQDRLFYDLQREAVDRNYQLKVNVVAPAVKKDSTAAKHKTTPKTKTSYLYAGLIGAPDLSTVKMQSVKEVGNTFGALVGYAFNSHWAIETGAYLERKKYYTEGQYFSKEAWTSPDTLNNVNGTCNMWEIPLNLRYTFNPDSKTRWFATAGFTTYLMTKENYTYNYEWNGWTDNINKSIKKTSPYPFSIISFSAGFEQRLGKVGNLRIEPYLRIPLTGMGAGKLPIMSTGINIGITRQLWKK